jgi:hypothetical protein
MVNVLVILQEETPRATYKDVVSVLNLLLLNQDNEKAVAAIKLKYSPVWHALYKNQCVYGQGIRRKGRALLFLTVGAEKYLHQLCLCSGDYRFCKGQCQDEYWDEYIFTLKGFVKDEALTAGRNIACLKKHMKGGYHEKS